MAETITFSSVQDNFFAAYNQKAYAEALDRLTRESVLLPEYAAIFRCWRLGLMALLNDTTGAIALLEEAYDVGDWYHEGALLNDPDFTSLRELLPFQRLVQKNKERREHAQLQMAPTLTVLQPEASAEKYPLLLALHGTAQNTALFLPHWEPAVDLGWMVAVPQSSQTMWVSGFYDWTDQDRAAAEIQQHLEILIHNYPVDPDRIVIAGFSMGGIMTQRLVLAGETRMKGFCLIEGWSLETLSQPSPAIDTPPRGFLVGGTTYIDEARQAAAAFQAKGYECQIEEAVHTHHSFPANFPDVLARALTFLDA